MQRASAGVAAAAAGAADSGQRCDRARVARLHAARAAGVRRRRARAPAARCDNSLCARSLPDGVSACISVCAEHQGAEQGAPAGNESCSSAENWPKASKHLHVGPPPPCVLAGDALGCLYPRAMSHNGRNFGTGLDGTVEAAGPGPQGAPPDHASAAATSRGADRPGSVPDPPAATPSRRSAASVRGVLGWPPAWMRWRRERKSGGGGPPRRDRGASESGSAGESSSEWDPLHEKVPPSRKGCNMPTSLLYFRVYM